MCRSNRQRENPFFKRMLCFVLNEGQPASLKHKIESAEPARPAQRLQPPTTAALNIHPLAATGEVDARGY